MLLEENNILGKYLVNILLSKGYYVKIISRSSYLSQKNFTVHKPGQYQLINCDIKNSNKLEACLRGSDHVINLVGLLVNKKVIVL